MLDSVGTPSFPVKGQIFTLFSDTLGEPTNKREAIYEADTMESAGMKMSPINDSST